MESANRRPDAPHCLDRHDGPGLANHAELMLAIHFKQGNRTYILAHNAAAEVVALVGALLAGAVIGWVHRKLAIDQVLEAQVAELRHERLVQKAMQDRFLGVQPTKLARDDLQSSRSGERRGMRVG